MRKVGASVAVAACAAVICCSPPAAAFGLRIGPFHIGVPLHFPHFRYHHHPLYMRASRHDAAPAESSGGVTSALLYPNLALPAIFQNVFFPDNASPWPFNYERIFSTAFARLPASEDRRLCQPSVDTNAIVSRIGAEVAPNADQEQALQKLGGALGAASGFLAKSCPTDIPVQPVARLRLMESQIEELTMAVSIVRQPLQDFEQALNDDQKAKFAAVPASAPATDHQERSAAIAPSCGGSATAIDATIDQIDRSVQPNAAAGLGRRQSRLRQGRRRPPSALSNDSAADRGRAPRRRRVAARRDLALGAVESGCAGELRKQVGRCPARPLQPDEFRRRKIIATERDLALECPVLRIPIPFEIGDQRRAEMAEGLLARIDRHIAAE